MKGGKTIPIAASMLTHQKQKYKDSCGPTCVAILANTTQAKAIFAMFCQRRNKFCHSWYADVRRGLDELGLNYGKTERAVTRWSAIRGLSIVSVNDDDHWVVYSPSEKLVYDPLRKKPVRVEKYQKKPCSYLTVTARFNVAGISE